MNNIKISGSLLLTTVVLLSGCVQQPTTLEAEFGDSVRSVMDSQVHDRDAAANPDPDAVEGGDSYRLDKALEAHRGDVVQPQQAQRPINISVGN